MACAVEARLLQAVRESEREYQSAATLLRLEMGTSTKESFAVLLRRVELARTDAILKRQELRRHVASHRCAEDGSPSLPRAA